MTDFENTELNVGDNVIVAFNQYKTTKLKRGIVVRTNVKQVNMIMAVVSIDGQEKRVAQWNIFKCKGN